MTRSSSPPASPGDAIGEVRARFLAEGNPYGCAETALIVLQRAFGLEDASDGAAAMALNGGVAYSGGTCGAITGAAMALGRLAERRIAVRGDAKRVARELTAGLLDGFRAEFGATDCRSLTGVDLRAPGGHDGFIAAGAWRVSCVRQLEHVVERLAPLADPEHWAASVAALEGAPNAPGIPAPAGSADEGPARR